MLLDWTPSHIKYTNTDTKTKTKTNINININMINFATPLIRVRNFYKYLMYESFDDNLRYLLVMMSSDLFDKTNVKEEVHILVRFSTFQMSVPSH